MTQYSFTAQRPLEKYHRCDIGFLVSFLMLWGLGLFTIIVCSKDYSINLMHKDAYYLVRRHLISSGIGFGLFMTFLFLDMNFIRKLVVPMLIVTILLCGMIFIKPLSSEINGATRWVKFPGGFTFQPSELVKFTLVLYMALYFEKQEEKEDESEKSVLVCVAVFVSFLALVLGQRDFSTTFFIMLVGILLFFVAGQKLNWLIPFGVIFAFIIFLVVTTNRFRLDRITGWLNPTQGHDNINMQANNAKTAISAGGFWGQGIGFGLSKLNKIPEVHADYIFAGWAESMGYIGVIIYLCILGFFGWRGYKTSLQCPTRFGAYGSFGCVSIIVMQSIANVMVVCGLLPSTGIPLPFFSVGGSSVMISMAMCGFILNTSRGESRDDYAATTIDELTIDDLTVL